MADVQIGSDSANITAVNLVEQGSDPSAPGSGHALLYVRGGVLYVRRTTGDPAPVSGSASLTAHRIGLGDGSGVLSALAAGTEGQLLTSHGASDPAWEDAPEGGTAGGDGVVSIHPFAYSAVSGSTYGFAVDYSDYGCGYWYHTSAAPNDYVTFPLFMSAGTWTLRVLFHRNNSAGIITPTIDGQTLATFDAYNASPSRNTPHDWSGIVVSASGLKTLTFTVASKNASSLNYWLALQAIALWRTA